ncbi:hypothetical protein NHX12_024744, partial [Muraenolepis orangiensis]
MFKTPCTRLSGLVGATVRQKVVGSASTSYQTVRSLIHLYRKEPSNWITYQQLRFLKRQYVTKGNSELHQRAVPKETAALPVVEDGEDGVVRRVQHVPAIHPFHAAEVAPRPDNVTGGGEAAISDQMPDPSAKRTVLQTEGEVETPREAPHLQVESDKAREERLDRQWKEVKVDVAELPGVYARLAKSRLTALVVMTAAAGYAMAPVPFDPGMFFLACLGTGLSSCAANSINQVASLRDAAEASLWHALIGPRFIPHPHPRQRPRSPPVLNKGTGEEGEGQREGHGRPG